MTGANNSRKAAAELVRELAIKGMSARGIRKQLDRCGLHGVLEAFEIENLIHEGHYIVSLMTPKPSYRLEIAWLNFRTLWGGIGRVHTGVPGHPQVALGRGDGRNTDDSLARDIIAGL